MRHPYSEFLARVEKPARYVGGEYNEVRKDPATVRARVCLAFPDVYEIGMSHLGTKILYGVLNKTDGIACERAFAPWGDCEAELRKRGLPVLTLESATPLREFDVIGFSLQYELTYTNVLNLLDLSGLPLRAAERGDDAPLVIAGGPTATHPEPLAPFIDAFFIGEAEEQLPPLVLEAAELRRAGVPRRERLAQLAAKYPLYVPELYETTVDAETGFVVVDGPTDPRVPARPKRVWVADINRFPFPDDSPLPYAEAIFDRMAVEVARGCTEGCRFCQAGMIYRPVRERDPVAVIDALVGGVKKGGYDETALTSLSTADYSCVTPLVKAAMSKLRDEKVSLSVSSLRAYGLNEDLLGEMATVRAGGLTFAPEAGTQRMRDVITKNVTEEDIVESAHRVFGRGFQRMKLYFMIGLPTEEDVDVAGIVETAARVQSIGRQHLRAAKVVASVSTHVPKPHTPFQWCAMDTEAETERKQTMLAAAARRLRVDLKTHENQQSHIEGIFSRGDRRCADLLERAFRLGCRFDGWDDVLRMDLWQQAIDEAREGGLEIDRYLGTIPVTARLPWDHIDIGLEPSFLAQEYRKALKDRLSPPCGKIYKRLLHPNNVADAEALAGKKLVCYDCGVACDLDQMKAERLYYLRRMNAWTPPVANTTPRLNAPTNDIDASAARLRRAERRDRVCERQRARPRQKEPGAAAASDAPRAGHGAPVPAALHEARPRRVPGTPRSHPPPAAHLPARRRRALLLGGLPPQARSVVRPGARARHPLAGRAHRRVAHRRPRARGAAHAPARRDAGGGRLPRGRAPREQRPRARARHHERRVRGAAARGRRRRDGPRAVVGGQPAVGAARVRKGASAHDRRAALAARRDGVRGRGDPGPPRVARGPARALHRGREHRGQRAALRGRALSLRRGHRPGRRPGAARDLGERGGAAGRARGCLRRPAAG